MIKSKIIKEVPMRMLVGVFMGVLCAQFSISNSFTDSIETSNYFTLLLFSGFLTVHISDNIRKILFNRLCNNKERRIAM